MRNNITLSIAILTALVLTVGCSDKLATISVTGKVTYDGEPLAGASVMFSPTSPEGHAAYGTTDASGNYKLQTLLGDVDAGTTPGTYAVTITKTEGGTVASTEQSGASVPDAGPPPPPKSLIPERYRRTDTSGLTATVANTKEGRVHNFDLVK